MTNVHPPALAPEASAAPAASEQSGPLTLNSSPCDQSPVTEAEKKDALTKSDQPSFPRFPGETPRAYSAFITYFQLGHTRSHQAVADKLDDTLPTIKKWSSKYNWSDRLHHFNAGLLQKQAEDLAALQRKEAADWAQRLNRFREQEWDAAQKLLTAAQCFLENFGEEEVEKMTLSQVSRALRISSQIGRSALAGAELPLSTDPAMSPIQQQMLDALRRLSAPSNPAVTAATPAQVAATVPVPMGPLARPAQSVPPCSSTP